VTPQVAAGAAEHYRDRPVLVTGGASFIGAHLSAALVAAGARVRVVDDLSTGRSEALAGLDLELEVADLRRDGVAERAVAGIDTVFHLAARHGGREYVDAHPLECVGNVALDHVLLRAARECRRIVFTSSACVYPLDAPGATPRRAPWSEPEAGFDVPGAAFADGEYGWAKLYTELQLRALHRAEGVGVGICRLFNVYGPRESDTHAIVALVDRALRRIDPFTVWGDGTQQRCFTHVTDTVRGLLAAGRADGFGVHNIASDRVTTIDELVEAIFAAVGWRPERIEHLVGAPTGALSRIADVSRAAAELGWRAEVPLEEGLAELVAHRRRLLADDPPA